MNEVTFHKKRYSVNALYSTKKSAWIIYILRLLKVVTRSIPRDMLKGKLVTLVVLLEVWQSSVANNIKLRTFSTSSLRSVN